MMVGLNKTLVVQVEKLFLQNEGGCRDGMIHEKGHKQDASAEHEIMHPFLKSGRMHSLKRSQETSVKNKIIHPSLHFSLVMNHNLSDIQ